MPSFQKSKKNVNPDLPVCGFTLKHYQGILDLLKLKGYQFSDFAQQPNANEKRVYLRHDVDYSLDKALAMARLEHAKEVAATYFAMTRCLYYNLLAFDSIAKIKEILSLGHSVGLHFECLPEKGRRQKEAISLELEIANKYFNIGNIVSFHRPSKDDLGKEADLAPGILNAYNPVFFRSQENRDHFLAFFSDSANTWREGCICSILDKEDYQNIQLLIHPIWWVDSAGEMNKTLYRFWDEKKKEFDAYCAKEKIRGYVPLYKTAD